MRGTGRLLVSAVALLLSGPVAPSQADFGCAAPFHGVRMLGRYSLGPALEQEQGDMPSQRYAVTVEDHDGRRVRIVIVTPSVMLAYGGLSYTLIVDSPGIGVCVDPAGGYQVYLGDILLEAAGSTVPTLEVEVPPVIQSGAHRCHGTDRVAELPELPLDLVRAEATTNGCRHTFRAGPR